MKLLLCTDMDRTVIPNGLQPETPGARAIFSRFCAQSAVTLVYVTGRHLALMQEAIDDYELPQPDYAITDVGTRIYHRVGDQWISMQEWEDEINQEWQNIEPAHIIELVMSIEGVILQEAEKQNPHKISFYVDLEKLNESSCLSKVVEKLSILNIPTNLIWSIDETSETGLLDILPPRANKLHAIEFLQGCLHYGPTEVVFAGDSGNDLQVLTSSIQSVLVANATEELKMQALNSAEQEGTGAHFYLAQTLKDDNGYYSSGVLQGVYHYCPELKKRWNDVGRKENNHDFRRSAF